MPKRILINGITLDEANVVPLLFFYQPKKLFKNPIIGLGMLFMKTCEFGFGGIGYFVGKFKNI